MKILLTNCWQSGNTGDNAIWKNLMRRFREVYPDCSFIIASQSSADWDIEQLKEYSPEVVNSELIADLKEEDIQKLKTKEEILNYWSQISSESVSEALKNANIVISQGGGYMIGEGMWRPLTYFYIAQTLRKPTYFATQTFVGPVSDTVKTMIEIVLNRANLVFPREELSYSFLKECDVNEEKMTIIPDQVFDVKSEAYNKSLPKDSIKIGIRSYAAPIEFLQEIAGFADMIVETIAPVVFIPIGHDRDRNDTEGSIKMASYMKHESIIVDDKPSAGQLMSIMKDGILISDRYHGIIYAISMMTPFIAMTPDIDNKMPGLLNMFDYPISVLDTKSVTKKELFDHTLNIYQNREKYQEFLKYKLPIIKKQAKMVYDLIIENYENTK